MGIEKRRARRDKHDSVVEIFDGSGKLKGTGRLADFSLSGISFSSEETFRKGEKLCARLRLLGKGVMEASGEVVWAREENNRRLYGVKFDSLRSIFPTGEAGSRWD